MTRTFRRIKRKRLLSETLQRITERIEDINLGEQPDSDSEIPEDREEEYGEEDRTSQPESPLGSDETYEYEVIEEENTALMADIATLVTALNGLVTQMGTQSGRSEPKLEKIEPFRGKAETLDSFIQNCELAFELQPRTFANEGTKIKWAVYNMEGYPAEFFKGARVMGGTPGPVNPQYVPGQNGQGAQGNQYLPAPPHWPWADWTAFSRTLKEMYGDATIDVKAKEKLIKLRQGNRTIGEFVTEIYYLQTMANFDDTTLRTIFEQGLTSNKIKEEIVKRETPFATLHDLVIFAVKLESKLQPERSNTFTTQGRMPFRRFNPQFPIRRPWIPNTMINRPASNNLPAPRQNPNTSSGPTPMDWQYTQQVNSRGLVCYRCGKNGHIQRNCPNPPRQMAVRRVEEEKEENTEETKRIDIDKYLEKFYPNTKETMQSF